MESDDEFISFSDSEKPSSPAPLRKLKRLKKATGEALKDSFPDPSVDELSTGRLNPSDSETLDAGGKSGEDFEEEPNPSSESQSESFEKGNELDSGLDGFGVEDDGFGAKRALDFDSVAEEFDGTSGIGVVEESRDLTTEEPEKKRRSSDEFEETKEKKKKRVKSGVDGRPDLAAPSKRRENKDRKARHKELLAESQRLLRETRDASFKPAPLVQKPVSSVLEKIRQRKLEVSKKSFVTSGNSYIDANDAYSEEGNLDFDFDPSPTNAEEKSNDEEMIADLIVKGKNLDAESKEESDDTSTRAGEGVSCQMDLDDKNEQVFRAPVDDTQDLIFDSEKSDSKDELPDEMPGSPLEEVLAPSLLAMNLKLDSAPPDDDSSDEEDNDKENIDPLKQRLSDVSLSPRGDPVKAFVDEEAEEEDDSDNDLSRFQDEEDEDNIDSDELNDIIGTEYDEKPVDNEMRNDLHQKWLEKQDAVGTENLLQRLQCGSGLRKMDMLEEKDSEGEEDDEDGVSLDEPMDNLFPRNIVRMNLKKAKEMIHLMFTDKEDVYLSSDDETEKRPYTHHPSAKVEQHATFLSPAEDEGSKGFFGLIKKLNGVPDTRKKAKITSNFHMQSIGGQKNVSSKSSFLSRGSKNSLPSFQKQGSGTVRGFIFERDDSNSRSSISMSEETLERVQKENRPRKTAQAKFSTQQMRSSSQNTQPAAEPKLGPSLHEILRCPSIRPSLCNRDGMVGQVEAIYASFKLDENVTKKERKVSVRI